MKDYWLAKLIASVGEVDSRKRLQKSIFLLQLSGCPLKCDYLLHYYGPYSFELAALVDQLNGAQIIEEKPEQLGQGVVRYRSIITEPGKKSLTRFENTKKGRQLLVQIEPFVGSFGDLNKENAWVLELAATTAFYHQGNWNEAKAQTAHFKKLSLGDGNLKKAIDLAMRFKKSA
jgi:uncharacterized protein YwgA